MSGSNKSHFNPGATHSQFMVLSEERQRYQGNKHSVTADLMAAEFCMNKCNLNFANQSALQASDATCLRQCSLKFFESTLLIDNEMTNYVRGLPI